MSINREAVHELYSVASCILEMLKEGKEIEHEWVEKLGDAVFVLGERTGWQTDLEESLERTTAKGIWVPTGDA